MNDSSEIYDGAPLFPLPDDDASLPVADSTVGIGDVLRMEGEERIVVGVQGETLIHYLPRTEEFGYTLAEAVEYALAGDADDVIEHDADLGSVFDVDNRLR